MDVIVLDNTGVTATATPPQILQGESSQITLDMPVFSSYEWSPSGTLNAANIANPIASPPVTTDYSVTVTATSGCQFTATVRVVVLNPECAEPFIFLPTGFSPNGDGENDMLKMEGRFADEVYWAVYNRWGEKVFEANSLDEYWDGRYRGTLQPAETYGYYYRIRCQDGQVREKKGNLTLIR